MTETSAEPPNQAAPGGDIPIHPSDILLNVVVSLLAPMFMAAAGNQAHLARMAAIEAVNAYRARTSADLIAVAHIVSFGLAAVSALGLAMADNLSLSMTLRLRGNANALSRVAERNRRALKESHADQAVPRQATTASTDDPAPDPAYEQAVTAEVAATRQLVAQAQAKMTANLTEAEPAAALASIPGPIPAPIPAPAPAAVTAQTPVPATPCAATTPTEQQLQAKWAEAMADVAGEFTASLPHLPKIERLAASRRAALLSSCATHLVTGANLPSFKYDPSATLGADGGGKQP